MLISVLLVSVSSQKRTRERLKGKKEKRRRAKKAERRKDGKEELRS